MPLTSKIKSLPILSQSKQFSIAYPKVHNVQFLCSSVALSRSTCCRHVEFAVLFAASMLDELSVR